MPELDKLAAKIGQGGIERMVLTSDQPMHFFTSDGRRATGPAMPTQQLEHIVKEVAPAHLLTLVQDDSDVLFQFPYQAPEGLICVHVNRQNKRLQVDLTPFDKTAKTARQHPQVIPPTNPIQQVTKPSKIPPTVAQPDTSLSWYYAIDDKQLGPVNHDTMTHLAASGHIFGNTLVWHEGMPDWTQAKLTELDTIFPVQSSVAMPVGKSGVGVGNGSGKGEYSSPMPTELQGFNWGACLIPFFWGIGHNTWIALWCLAIGAISGCIGPAASGLAFGASIGFGIWLGNQGNELAWRNRRWDSIEQFRDVQKRWAGAGVAVLVLCLVFIGMYIESANRMWDYNMEVSSASFD